MDRAGPVPICDSLNALAEAQGWPVRCDGSLDFERAELRELHALWRAQAAEGVPKRSAFGMRVLMPFARNCLVLEREGQGAQRRYRFRLFGTSLALLFGEHTGHTLEETVSPKLLPSWLAIYDAVLAQRAVLRIVTHFRLPSEGFLKGEVLAAPMCDEAGEAKLILGATFVSLRDATASPFETGGLQLAGMQF